MGSRFLAVLEITSPAGLSLTSHHGEDQDSAPPPLCGFQYFGGQKIERQ